VDIHFDFFIDEILFEEDSCRVRGRCLVGPIFPGDIFNLSYKLVTYRQGFDDFSYSREVLEPVELKVIEIVAYRRVIAELSEGMSGELKIIGLGHDKLRLRGCIAKMF
jgi:hypothetical protein